MTGSKVLARMGQLLAAITMAAGVHAQTVVGRVTDAGVGMSGVVVLLVDSAGKTVRRAISAERGDFALAAGVPGRFTIRALKIGRTPTDVGPIVLAPGAVARADVALSGRVVILDETR